MASTCPPVVTTRRENEQDKPTPIPRHGDDESGAVTTDNSITISSTNPATTPYQGPDSSSEISHRYLTFTTPIPAPNTTIQAPHHDPNTTTTTTPVSSTPPARLAKYTNPVDWPSSKKNLMLALSCVATLLTAYTSGSYSPPQSLMRADLGAPSDVAVLAGITTFCVGFGLAPMALAPLSEMNGRYPVFVASGVVYVVFQAVCGLVRSLAGMLAARFFVGVGASVFSTMVGGVIADMWGRDGRNTPMALFSGSVLVGTGLGPLAAAVMTFRMGEGGEGVGAAWKWIFWHQVIMSAVLMVALVWLLEESRGSVLLSKKAGVLNQWYEELEGRGYFGLWVGEEGAQAASDGKDDDDGDVETSTLHSRNDGATTSLRRIRWKVKEDEERSSLAQMVSVSVYRPFHLLVTESVVFFFSLWVAFAWGVLYLTFGSIPLVFRRQYGWNIEQAGLVFIALIVGAILATAIGIWSEQLLQHPKWRATPTDSSTSTSSTSSSSDEETGAAEGSSGSTSPPAKHDTSSSTLSDRVWAFLRRRFPAEAPESRLYFTCLVSALLPVGLFVFGLTARPETHWAAPALGITLATMGILSIYLAVFNYLADTYHKYASSALAAQSLCRNLVGGSFALVTSALIVNMGEARAIGMLGAIAAGLSVVPWVLVFFGDRIRGRSPFASVSVFDVFFFVVAVHPTLQRGGKC